MENINIDTNSDLYILFRGDKARSELEMWAAGHDNIERWDCALRYATNDAGEKVWGYLSAAQDRNYYFGTDEASAREHYSKHKYPSGRRVERDKDHFSRFGDAFNQSFVRANDYKD